MVKISKSGKNSTNALYNETTKPERSFNLKKALKKSKITKQFHGYKGYADTFNVKILNFLILNYKLKILNLKLEIN